MLNVTEASMEKALRIMTNDMTSHGRRQMTWTHDEKPEKKQCKVPEKKRCKVSTDEVSTSEASIWDIPGPFEYGPFFDHVTGEELDDDDPRCGGIRYF